MIEVTAAMLARRLIAPVGIPLAPRLGDRIEGEHARHLEGRLVSVQAAVSVISAAASAVHCSRADAADADRLQADVVGARVQVRPRDRRDRLGVAVGHDGVDQAVGAAPPRSSSPKPNRRRLVV